MPLPDLLPMAAAPLVSTALTAAQVWTVAAMWTVAVVTPGPNFLAAARIAAARDRRAGFAAVGGIGFGTMLWGLAGAFGVHAMFVFVPWLFAALKLVGAGYLLFIGGRIILGSFGPERPPAPPLALGPAFRTGLLTSISNPKSALFVGSLFAAIMPLGAPLAASLSAVVEMVAISVGWYTLVVALLTTRRAAAAYGRLRRWLDRLAGAVFMSFGARLILERT
jgi:threonine/homoserine/homoserine lactone efflux protein